MDYVNVTIDWSQRNRKNYAVEKAMSNMDLVRAMRAAQKDYYRHGTRSRKNRKAVLERMVDERLEQP